MDKTSSARETALAAMFPDGVAARAKLVALGHSHSWISRRCREGGPWRRPIPGVILLTSATPTSRQLLKVALTHAGPEAMLTGVQAARLYGVRRLPPERRAHTLIPHRSKVATWGFAVVERTIHLPEPVEIDGLPVAPLARALIDAARRMDELKAVREMIHDAVHRGLCTPEELRDELAQASTIGSALPRIVVNALQDGVNSAVEQWLESVLERSGLPGPARNAELRTSDGEVVGVADAWWPQVGVAVQVRHAEVALEPGKVSEAPALVAPGLIVVQVSPARLRDEPLVVIQELRAAHRRARQRPPPDVGFAPAAPAA
ncbi:hypothetical protein DMH03_41505 [Amycolatopsis sp. WAC 01376]|uniref:hypothetical protein n=1 Tax=Amycolatopsis sp. WAC 01376 TaxID=2203195 RepID=UPI000F7A7B41|nr:hypothetical protein [Amycolatopsis sp. WAC 01376]RSM52033.1 hypothetical protein DMH03_41505 [Amycolatopsis sp. WAC 01376]